LLTYRDNMRHRVHAAAGAVAYRVTHARPGGLPEYMLIRASLWHAQLLAWGEYAADAIGAATRTASAAALEAAVIDALADLRAEP
jgi:hypothetical protein